MVILSRPAANEAFAEQLYTYAANGATVAQTDFTSDTGGHTIRSLHGKASRGYRSMSLGDDSVTGSALRTVKNGVLGKATGMAILSVSKRARNCAGF